ncbi:cell shape determination protein CcmA [Orenia metallireducens]|jgi:cytoskeletal protein CcmA (bactofilin family)|uniref:Cell shape determination protein CcmA n=1 Tax=Orenia metallireducens TaxID=1413210 RepID=A0A1C0ACV3_9FIRM|nr:polymer-forming cytoskeletal protein [Orenia metallireducens]OCL28455.1 cell shape determination protein CcmA [Orenia metallireducens]
MFGKKKKEKKEKKEKKAKDIATIISAGTHVEGIIKVAESIRIDGELDGQLIVEGNIYVGKEGKLTANVQGDNIMIAGFVEGNVKAEGRLEIVETGKLIGDISISNLIIHDGATFQGNSTSKAEIDQKISESQKSLNNKAKEEVKNNKSKEDSNNESNNGFKRLEEDKDKKKA